jgi:hypothetical protein
MIYGGTDENTNAQLVLAVDSSQNPPAIILADIGSDGEQDQTWLPFPGVLQPNPPTKSWGYFKSALSPTRPFYSPLVLNIDYASTNPGTNVILYPLQANSDNELWQITSDGHIVSAMASGLVLDLGDPITWDGQFSVVSNAWSYPTVSSQQWTFNNEGMIVNQKTNSVINVNNASTIPGTQIVTYGVQSGSSAADEIWYFNTPSYPLNDILAQAPQPFTTFTGGQAEAYVYINTQLGLAPPAGDLRSQYINTDLSDTFAAWSTAIRFMTPPEGVSIDDWNAVVNQLTTELTAVSSVQTLFINFNMYYGDVFDDNGALLNKLGTDAQMEEGSSTQVGSTILSLFEGIAYTVLSAVPGLGEGLDICAVLGNLMETAVAVGTNAANAQTSISPSPFSVAYSDLWGTLSSNFVALLNITSNMATTILSDWGKLQATYGKTLSLGSDSLAWPEQLTAQLVAQAVNAYTIFVMQMLLPVQF